MNSQTKEDWSNTINLALAIAEAEEGKEKEEKAKSIEETVIGLNIDGKFELADYIERQAKKIGLTNG